jgi:hypothetical protein
MGDSFYNIYTTPYLFLLTLFFEGSDVGILWNHHFSRGTNVRGFRGSPLLTNLHPHEHKYCPNRTIYYLPTK